MQRWFAALLPAASLTDAGRLPVVVHGGQWPLCKHNLGTDGGLWRSGRARADSIDREAGAESALRRNSLTASPGMWTIQLERRHSRNVCSPPLSLPTSISYSQVQEGVGAREAVICHIDLANKQRFGWCCIRE